MNRTEDAPEPPPGLPAKVARWRGRVDEARGRAETTFVWRIWERLLENEFVDRSVALGAKAFVAFFPFIIVVGAFVGPSVRRSIIATLQGRFGLTGNSVTTVKQAFASSGDIKRATGAVGLLFLFFYATTFTTALQRAFTRAWRRPRVGQGIKRLRAPSWLAAIIAFAAVLGALRHVLTGGPGTVGFYVLSLAISIGLWWSTAWLMLLGQVRWRPLLPTGVFVGLGINLYAVSASIWMPGSVAGNQSQFGFFGVALALVSWFTGAGAVIVIGSCMGASLADEPGRLGRFARGGDGPVLTAGALPALPGPTRQLSLVNALGMRTADEDGHESDHDGH